MSSASIQTRGERSELKSARLKAHQTAAGPEPENSIARTSSTLDNVRRQPIAFMKMAHRAGLRIILNQTGFRPEIKPSFSIAYDAAQERGRDAGNGPQSRMIGIGVLNFIENTVPAPGPKPAEIVFVNGEHCLSVCLLRWR